MVEEEPGFIARPPLPKIVTFLFLFILSTLSKTAMSLTAKEVLVFPTIPSFMAVNQLFE